MPKIVSTLFFGVVCYFATLRTYVVPSVRPDILCNIFMYVVCHLYHLIYLVVHLFLILSQIKTISMLLFIVIVKTHLNNILETSPGTTTCIHISTITTPLTPLNP